VRRWPVGVVFLVTGSLHFLRPRAFEVIVPAPLPAKRAIVYVSGAAEMAGGAGVLVPRTSALGGGWLIALLVAVFPANVNMALNAERFARIPAPLLWLRLPLQAVLIAWVWWATLRAAPAPRRAVPGWRPRRRARARLAVRRSR
jgi:uncharacterized membrane protein